MKFVLGRKGIGAWAVGTGEGGQHSVMVRSRAALVIELRSE